jgi:hypothetical protein
VGIRLTDAPRGARARLQRRAGSKWTTLATRTAGASATTFALRLAGGKAVLRAQVLPSGGQATVSKTLTVNVR